jgi:chemotaxis protein MotB
MDEIDELTESQDNFWISYADLMAGLLFVFILVIGAIIVKHNFMTAEFTEQKKSIQELENNAKLKEAAAEKLNKELNETKQTIAKLTSVKEDVIAKLRLKLGDKIEVDPKSGSLRIAGNILFKQNEYELIEESKISLTSILSEYIKVLMEDQEIRNNLDRIIVEGHTNSDGDYLLNLELSQKRALSVMKFLLELNPQFEKDLKVFVTANGRSETDLIFKNNEEDKFASRRIEIKFRLKNEEAISSISKALEKK